MNTSSILETGTKVWSKDKAQRLVAMLRQYVRSTARFITENCIRSDKGSLGIALSYRLGQIVHHSRFGTGRVMAHWPDGTLLVKFDGADKNRMVFPSLLD
jgi:hypothetical protein